MAIGNGRGYQLRRANSETAVGEGLGFINSTRMIGRKRIVVSHCLDVSSFTSPPTTPPRKRSAIKVSSEKSLLEALPQDILIRILCRVDHDDLKQLFHVSKSIKEAALLADKLHFAFSTPSKQASFTNLEGTEEFEEAPNAPRQRRYRSRLSGAKLAGISVALFAASERQ